MDRLTEHLKKIGAEDYSSAAAKLNKYMDGILEWNEKINLTSITEKEEFISKHYLDSLTIAGIKEFIDASSIIDVGTGGGFPGIPLAASFPSKSFLLADSLNKRLKVIEALTSECDIKNVSTAHGRAEILANMEDIRESFDLCVSRAVADLPVLCEFCLPFVRVGGSFIAYKGPEPENEIERAARAIKKLGGKFIRVESFTESDFTHTLIVIKKVSKTPKAYPRKAGTPSKMPL